MPVRWPGKRGGKGSWALSILLHAAVAALAFGAWKWVRKPEPPQPLAIEGRVVSGAELRRLPPAPETPPPEPEPEPEPVVEPEPQPDAAAEEAARQAEEERVAEERRLAEQRLVAERKAQEQAQQVAEKAARDKAEKERQEKEKAAREKAEKEKAEKEKAEKERLAREKAEKEKAARDRAEKELSDQLAAEQRAAALRSSSAAQQYIAQIRGRIERAWIRPASAQVGLKCEVRVTQVPGGAVTDVQVGRCNGDEAVRQSIEAAVYRASPLPEPSDPALFDRNIVFNFEPLN